jgi:uncharacterized protein (TIGR02996 family)
VTEREQFEVAIVAAPKDDALRKVYADWLDEHDEPEEATRQRQWVASYTWLEELAAGCTVDTYDPETREDHERPMTAEDLVQAGRDWVVRAPDVNDWMSLVTFFSNFYSEEAEAALDDPEKHKLFWDHWSVVTGVAVADQSRGDGAVFHCGCR